MLPNMGYTVRTLHGLAHDIVRERPDLVGLGDGFQIIDEREASWIPRRSRPPGCAATPTSWTATSIRLWMRTSAAGWSATISNLVNDTALALIRYAKDQQLDPQQMRQRMDKILLPLPLAEMGRGCTQPTTRWSFAAR